LKSDWAEKFTSNFWISIHPYLQSHHPILIIRDLVWTISELTWGENTLNGKSCFWVKNDGDGLEIPSSIGKYCSWVDQMGFWWGLSHSKCFCSLGGLGFVIRRRWRKRGYLFRNCI